ncbi:WAT1-related protein, partial [Tanacetum coccineum]
MVEVVIVEKHLVVFGDFGMEHFFVVRNFRIGFVEFGVYQTVDVVDSCDDGVDGFEPVSCWYDELGLRRPVMDQNLYFAGMKYTTATFATAMCNIVPAITFVMAWMFSSTIVDAAVTLKSYPAELSLTTLVCMMGTLEGSVLALVAEGANASIWSVNWDIKLFAALYG